MNATIKPLNNANAVKTAEIIKFPRKELDLSALNWIQERNQVTARENAARRYSESCNVNQKRNALKEDIMCVISGVSMFASLAALYFIMCCF